MTPLLWVMVGGIVVKLLLLISLIRSIRESRASIKRSHAILNERETQEGDDNDGRTTEQRNEEGQAPGA